MPWPSWTPSTATPPGGQPPSQPSARLFLDRARRRRALRLRYLQLRPGASAREEFRMAKSRPAETAPADRWAELGGERFDDEEDEDHFDDEVRGEGTAVTRGRRKPSKPKARSRAKWDELIEADIRQKGREELADLVVSLVDRFPELREEF